MNIRKADEALQPTVKKHKTAKIGDEVRERFGESSFGQSEVVCANFAKIVSKSTMVSLFEKPKVRDAVKAFNMEQFDTLSIALYEVLHGGKQEGFESMVEVLAPLKLAKWSLVTLIPYYYDREHNYFIKPTTTKEIIKFFEMDDVQFKPRPSYAFYEAYTKHLDAIRTHLDFDYGNDNAAFTGMLMMGVKR
jgi:hypothetical protein